jgi:hypothetical protein
MHEVCAAPNAAHNAPGLSECYGLSLPGSHTSAMFSPRPIVRFAFTVFTALASLSLGNAAEKEVTPDPFAALVTLRVADSENPATMKSSRSPGCL